MKLPALKKFQRVEVEWLDSASWSTQGWADIEDVDGAVKKTITPMKTVSYYLGKSIEDISLARSLQFKSSDPKVVIRVEGLFSIPMGIIKSIKEV